MAVSNGTFDIGRPRQDRMPNDMRRPLGVRDSSKRQPQTATADRMARIGRI